ncbi:MAG: hypothetical protein A2122_01490 [Candidatus Liptonbacteria bacterium GWB1_49_6]|uniref:Uncharacterized protein n=1 Tax=Candidatus Liptonbacteria bacterium GWB1_49_6 TaxID=1798644 RepID=A0A1G2CA21_9BACT|nr:MAG: hypothetical protein A2122_01490 [Candidatus Liptonbacteria bacterium GWB1_49_6]
MRTGRNGKTTRCASREVADVFQRVQDGERSRTINQWCGGSLRIYERLSGTQFSGNGRHGQSLIEVLVAVFIGILLFVAAASIIAPVLRSNTEVARMQTASSLAKQLMEHVVVFAGSDWHNISALPSGNYYLTTTTSPFALKSGEENLQVGTTTYKRYFLVEDVHRNFQSGAIDDVSDLDPSTKKVTVFYSWAGSALKPFTRYIMRTRNNVLVQTDWSGGAGQDFITTSTIGSQFFSVSNIEFASSVGSLVLAGVGVPLPPPVFTLTVNSNSFAGPASITIDKPDKSTPPQQNGSAPPSFMRLYDPGTEVTLIAQDDGIETDFWFRRWTKNGVAFSTSTTIIITMTADTTMTAVYWQ